MQTHILLMEEIESVGSDHLTLSSVDTKFAVQTSILAKRWIGIWKSLPFLNFNSISFSNENTKAFIECFYFVFTFRDDTNIQKFSVNWEDSQDDSMVLMNVNMWWLSAVKRDVQEFSIVMSECPDFEYEIPHLLLNSKSLRKLVIKVLDPDRFLDLILPRSMNLPQLKELTLDGLSISDEEFYKRLFSNRPVLETFWVCNCCIHTDNRRNLIVDSVGLKKFAYVCQQNDTTPNLIKLNAPNLEEFACISFLTQDCSLEICCTLSGARFYVFLKDNSEDENAFTYMKLPSIEKAVYAKRMMKSLATVYMVKRLELTPGCLEVLSQAPDLLDCQPPHLCNLQSLKLAMCGTSGCLQAVAYLLNISPNITQLVLVSEESTELPKVANDWEAGLSSPAMLSHLKYVGIEEAEGCDTEFKLLSYLLTSAKVLEKVSLFFRSSAGSPGRLRKVNQFKKKLRAVPAVSSSIKMVLY